MKLMIAVPTNRDHDPRFTISLVGLMVQSMRGVNGNPAPNITLNIKTQVSNIAQGRNELVREAMEQGQTHLLFLDDDMTFPTNTLDYLCRWNLPIVAANYCHKAKRLIYTAQRDDLRQVESRGRTGIERVLRIGLGVTLIDLSVLRDVPEPWFEIKWDQSRRQHVGEDFYFSHLMKERGVPIHVDHDLSNKVGHVGSHEFRFESYDHTPAG